MERQEYEQLSKSFQEIKLDLDELRKRCQTIERNYPRFERVRMFIDLSNALFTGADMADSLADHINASAENWKERR